MNFFRCSLRFTLVLLLCFIASGTLLSQQYNFRHYSVSDGLPVSRVNAAYQDVTGFMWIGTESGLARYDGDEFEFFDPNTGFPGSVVYAISESTEDGVLFSTDSGLVVYKYAQFFRITYPPNTFTHITAFTRGLNNELILATDKGLYEFKNAKITKVSTGTAVDNLFVTAITVDSRMRMWVGTDRNGLFQLQLVNGKYTNETYSDQERLVSARIRGVEEILNGELWIATSGNGLFSLGAGSLTNLKLPDEMGDPAYTCLHKDYNGDVWLGTWGGGLVHYSQGVFRNYSKQNGLNEDVITCVSSDRDGNTWIGSYNNGLFFYAGSHFTSITTSDGLGDNNITGIVQDAQGNTWISTVGGLSMYDGAGVVTWREKDGLSNDRLGAICTDGEVIYTGSMDGCVNEVRDGRIVVHCPSDSLNVGEIISMICADDGSVWIGTVANGLFKMKDGKFEAINAGNVLKRNPIWSLYVDVEGTLWLGTSHGLLRIDGGNAVRPTAADGRGTDKMLIYDVDGDETFIYFATQKSGIFRYDREKGRFEIFNTQEGLASEYTESILWTNQNSMYVATMTGLDKVSFTNDTNSVRHFFFSDGIGTENFAPGVILLGKEGNIWLGSNTGVIIYSPIGERTRNKPPSVEIKRALLFNSVTDWAQYADSLLDNGLPYDVELDYDKNSITFYLAGIQYGTGSNVTFEYQLIGLSEDWIPLVNASSISFTNLEPGDYTFNVRARNANNLWSTTKTFRFAITPPFWRSWWFFLLVLGVMTGLSILMLTTYRSFKTEFVRTHRSFYDHHLTTSRLVLLFGGVVYPVSGVLCKLFIPDLEVNGFVQLIIGACMLLVGLGTYINEFVRKYSTTLAYVGFSFVSVHVFYLTHINNLHPVLVMTLLVVMAASSLLLDHIRAVVAYSIAILIATALLMFMSSQTAEYNTWLLLLGVVISLIITFVTVVSRLNIFNRLIFADTTLNNSRSLVIATDATGNIVYVSRSIKAVLGYQPEELMGDGWWKVRSQDEEENAKMREKVSTFKGTTAPYVSIVTAKNGTKKWIQWVDTELPGEIRVGIGMDVSDRKEIEERYKHIVEAATDLIYTADYRGNFTFINGEVTKITGYKNEDLIGRHFTTTIAPDWIDEVRTFYARQFRKKTLSTYLEFPIITVEGEKRWLGQTVRIIYDAFRPTLIAGFQAIARDITDKKLYEEELEKLSLVASETINAVLICDPQGRIEWVNTGFSRITGYDLQEVKGKLPGDVLAGDRTDRRLISVVRQTSAEAEGFRKEFLVYHKEGYEIWIDVANSPIVDENGTVLKQIEIFTDITEKKRYEVQLNMYSARLETLNMAKHELLNSHNVKEIAQNVLGRLATRMSYVKRVSLAIFDERNQEVELHYVVKDNAAVPGMLLYPLRSFKSFQSLKENKVFRVDDIEAEAEISESDKEQLSVGIRSYLMMPVYSQNQLLGTVNIASSKPNAISDEDIDMVREVADAIAIALQQQQYLEIIEQKNADIEASILYARRIQEAILPPESMLKDQFDDLFVLYRPKDVLSGDFFWAEQRDNLTYLAVCDSTGHGVPGALLSLMGNNLLNQAVHERNLSRPSSILDYLNAGVQHTLNQYKSASELRDGMDISLCVFDHSRYKVQFAAAINPMYIIRDGMLIQSKGNRFSIGSYFDNKMRPFTNQEMELQSGDMIYLFTDGYPDQFGGEDDRKMSHRRFRELLMSIHHLPVDDQKKMLEEQLNAWMGDSKQTDDICVIGVRIR